HDAKAGAMTQIVLAPCSPFSVTSDLMKQSAKLAREYGVHLHTHLAETEDEEQFCMQMFGHRPVGYMQEVDWVGNDVWFAHAVWVNDEEIKVFAKHNCGVAHCPTSNMRLASGIAPVKEYRRAGVNVGLGVDGSASNDGSHLLAEVRNAMLVSRVKEGLTGYSASPSPSGGGQGGGDRKLMTAREALHLGTRGGAAVLGRNDIGSLEPGKCADFFAVNLNRLEFTGMHDPVSAIVFGQSVHVDYTVVNGRFIVKEGQLTTVDRGRLIERHNKAAKRLLAG
ncbi:MAG: amidohydrolase family protein, partial [Anaerolineales bacterium]|nr:amidohydrolase family protein [Anaerolineales bacterium]